MESRAKLLGHPIHQMLVVFPLGLLAAAVAFDLVALARETVWWYETSFYLMVAGVVTGTLAAIFGIIDYLGVPLNTRARRIGLFHGLGNAIVLLLFSASLVYRWNNHQDPEAIAITLSLAGALLSLLTAWLGGELVDRLGVGVDPGAHVNAPNSLTTPKINHSARSRSY